MLIAETTTSSRSADDTPAWTDQADAAGMGGTASADITLSRSSASEPTLTLDASTAKARSVVSDVMELSKPRIVTMILVTTVATAMMGAGGTVPALELLWLLIGTAGVAASAGAANQIWERVLDLGMTRTAVRPLPAGRMSTVTAVLICGTWGIGGTGLLWATSGITPAIVGAVTWILYVLVYTPMKTRTYWNTTVGAIAGALPVLIGYTATGGGIADLTGWLMFGVLAAWQYPHFMSIAWLYRRQYADAGFEMTTTVEPTGRSAAYQSIAGSLAILVCGGWLCMIDGFSAGVLLAVLLVIAATWPLMAASFRFYRSPDDATARKMLRASLLVLPAVLLVVTVRVLS